MPITPQLRDEALMMLDGKGAILDVARRVSRVMASAKLEGAVIGGVAVVLHGHVRTTVDVNLYVPGALDPFAQALQANGFSFNPTSREFLCEHVPVHLVTAEQATIAPKQRLQIEEVQTVSLADLLNPKLDSGTRNVLRAQDIADVIGLIRANDLTGVFARHIHKDLRSEFRRLVKAIQGETKG